jgi:hypothetical protein
MNNNDKLEVMPRRIAGAIYGEISELKVHDLNHPMTIVLNKLDLDEEAMLVHFIGSMMARFIGKTIIPDDYSGYEPWPYRFPPDV